MGSPAPRSSLIPTVSLCPSAKTHPGERAGWARRRETRQVSAQDPGAKAGMGGSPWRGLGLLRGRCAGKRGAGSSPRQGQPGQQPPAQRTEKLPEKGLSVPKQAGAAAPRSPSMKGRACSAGPREQQQQHQGHTALPTAPLSASTGRFSGREKLD